MRRRDVKSALKLAQECYELAHTPEPASVYKLSRLYGHGVEDEQGSGTSLDFSRQKMLDFALDHKDIFDSVVEELIRHHGDRRAKQLVDFLKGDKRLEQFSYYQRLEVRSDVDRIARKVRAYQGGRSCL